MGLSRRTFIKWTGAAGFAASALYMSRELGFSQPIINALTPTRSSKTPTGPGEKYISSVCFQCPAGCGIKVRVVNGRAVKIEGNLNHPINLGKLCPKGQIGLQILYDPDRIKEPLRRVGERGGGKWEPLSWNEAIKTVAGKLRDVRGKGEPHSVVFMNGRNRGQMGDFIGRFMTAYGSPNNVGHSSICADGSQIAHYLTQGLKAYLGYDWDNTNYLLCFGGGFIEAWRPTTRLLRAYGHMRRGRPIRAKIVQIDTRLSISAAKADEWVPINPGTDGALALGIAHVIVKEELYDKDYVHEHTFGFEDWVDEKTGESHIGFKTFVLRNYPPSQVAEITGVSESKIIQLAREFATTKPAIAAGERGSSMQSNGIYNRMAIHALNALVGSIDVPGGVLVQKGPPYTKFPDVVQDDVAKNGLKQPRIDYAGTAKYPLAGKVYQDLPESILSEKPYKVNIVLHYVTNPLFSSPDIARFHEAYRKVPFIVDFTPFISETAEFADIILPDHTYLERYHDDVIYPSLGYPVVAMRQPVVEPLYDTMNTGDVLIRLAREIGGTVSESFPWSDFLDFLKFRTKGLWEAKKGTIVKDTFEEFWDEYLRGGYWAQPPYKFGEWDRVFPTSTKKFEFYSENLKHKLEDLAAKAAKKNGSSEEEELEKILEGLDIHARGDEVYLPHYEPFRSVGNPSEYPLLLNTYKLMTHAEGRGANVGHLQEILAPHVRGKWDSWIEINPDTASKLGIANQDEVWVESTIGRIQTRAILYEGAMPQVVNFPFELGHHAYGRWAKGRGQNPNEILVNEHDKLGGTAAFFSTRVKVYKA